MTNPQGGDQPTEGQLGGVPQNMPPAPAGAPGPGYGATPTNTARNGMGIAALVLGIIALVFCWTVIGGIVLGILALIFGIIGWRRAKSGGATNGGLALSGAITGGIGLVIAVILLVVGASVFGAFLNSPEGKNLTQCLRDAGSDQAKIQQCQRQFEDQYLNRN